jgi:hypothetical protein
MGETFVTPDKASWLNSDSWESRHPPTDPYYREYAVQWFIPLGGLRSELRPSERDYLSLMIRRARDAGKVPVFGEVWSLGRAWAIKQALGGFHIFQYRNLWLQWLSYLSYKRKGSRTFYCSVLDTIFRDDDPYFQYLVDCGLKLAVDPRTGEDPTASPLWWTRSYVNLPREEEKVRRLELLPEQNAFAIFMGMRIYLYLRVQISADLSADVTRMARDDAYRADIERTVQWRTGLASRLLMLRTSSRGTRCNSTKAPSTGMRSANSLGSTWKCRANSVILCS